MGGVGMGAMVKPHQRQLGRQQTTVNEPRCDPGLSVLHGCILPLLLFVAAGFVVPCQVGLSLLLVPLGLPSQLPQQLLRMLQDGLVIAAQLGVELRGRERCEQAELYVRR